MWNWRFYHLRYKCSAFLNGSLRTILLGFKRETPGQTNCKFWQLTQEDYGEEEGKTMLLMLLLLLQCSYLFSWPMLKFLISDVNNFDKRFKLLDSKNLYKISHVLINPMFMFQDCGTFWTNKLCLHCFYWKSDNSI